MALSRLNQPYFTMFLLRSSTAPARVDRIESSLNHTYTVTRKSLLSRDLSLKPGLITQPSYSLKRKTTHKIYYQVEQNCTGCKEGITLSAKRRAFRRTVPLKSESLHLCTELQKISIFSSKYSFVWNAETYIWKRNEYGNLNIHCICPRTESILAEFCWKASIVPQIKEIGELRMFGNAVSDLKFQSVLVTAFFVTLDTLLEL
ncbi:hypothetical protein K7432_016398 [Basidiobolus ranarum]|uniref:Uncharacterized protein n=1 Tax=Basidiobolus ranarum TaxID=34480 RepID=A0ABR2WES8_9FUNG